MALQIIIRSYVLRNGNRGPNFTMSKIINNTKKKFIWASAAAKNSKSVGQLVTGSCVGVHPSSASTCTEINSPEWGNWTSWLMTYSNSLGTQDQP